jgi:serine/threonine-protein kinase
MDLEGARLSVHEPGCIELHTGSWNIVKPISLTLETFPGDAQWNYLRLEAAKLDPVDISGGGLNEDDAEFDDENEQAEEEEQDGEYTLRERTNEKLTEIDEHTYASRACWDENRYEGEKLPDSARVVVRWFGGAFVIFQKTSFYNLAHGKLDAYDGRHNRMDAEQFRSHIQELRNAVQEKGIDLRTRRIRERDTVREYYKDTLRHGR